MKHAYLFEDVVTFFFVYAYDPGTDTKTIKGYTDDKELLKFFLEFHNSPSYRVRKVKDTYFNIHNIIDANCRNSEIQIANIITRNRSGKHISEKTTMVAVPITPDELIQIHDIQNTTCGSIVDYARLNNLFPRLKGKYQKVLCTIGLLDVIRKQIHNIPSEFANSIVMDELCILPKLYPDTFS